MKSERAETIALRALAWLAANDDLWPTFLGSTGASVDDARDRSADPAFLGSVLEFLTMNDDWIVGFCDDAGLGYDEPLRARYALSGAAQINWT